MSCTVASTNDEAQLAALLLGTREYEPDLRSSVLPPGVLSSKQVMDIHKAGGYQDDLQWQGQPQLWYTLLCVTTSSLAGVYAYAMPADTTFGSACGPLTGLHSAIDSAAVWLHGVRVWCYNLIRQSTA